MRMPQNYKFRLAERGCELSRQKHSEGHRVRPKIMIVIPVHQSGWKNIRFLYSTALVDKVVAYALKVRDPFTSCKTLLRAEQPLLFKHERGSDEDTRANGQTYANTVQNFVSALPRGGRWLGTCGLYFIGTMFAEVAVAVAAAEVDEEDMVRVECGSTIDHACWFRCMCMYQVTPDQPVGSLRRPETSFHNLNVGNKFLASKKSGFKPGLRKCP